MRGVFKLIFLLLAVQLFTALSAQWGSALAADPPFVICDKQRYALCAEASCFVFDGVAYCECDVKHGSSISLQLGFTTSAGQQNVCDVAKQGDRNGYLVSTFSLPDNIKKGGPAAIYTCPGTDNAGSGVPAPVAYGQCDGGICSNSSRGQNFPGFEKRLRPSEIMCSCPVSTDATAGSSDALGYQIFGAYHPNAAPGSRCDASACAPCSVPNPTANGASIHVGAPTGSGEFLALKLNGPPLPALNQCLCTCSTGSNGTTCTLAEDLTP
jgi:hypothetical protein